MANSLSGLVGLTVGLPCSQVGTLFASVALVRIPNSYPGGFSATVRRNHPSIPLAAGAAFRRRGPSLARRLSARQRPGHTPPGPDRPRPAGLEQRGLAIRRAWRQSARDRSRRTANMGTLGLWEASCFDHLIFKDLRQISFRSARAPETRAPNACTRERSPASEV